jgi:hypothetical protein
MMELPWQLAASQTCHEKLAIQRQIEAKDWQIGWYEL